VILDPTSNVQGVPGMRDGLEQQHQRLLACSETCDKMHGIDQLAKYLQLMKLHQPHQQLTLGSGWMSMSYISQCAEFLSQA
jgi:hypothetical protein